MSMKHAKRINHVHLNFVMFRQTVIRCSGMFAGIFLSLQESENFELDLLGTEWMYICLNSMTDSVTVQEK